MFTGILHSHTGIVTLYLVLLLIKTVLLLANKKEALQKVRSKTRILEIVLGSLFIITGVWLSFLSAAANGAYFWVKIVAILAIVPLGIIAFKREQKVLGIFTLILFAYTYGISETKSLTLQKNLPAYYAQAVPEKSFDPSSSDYKLVKHGEYVYNKNCTSCHGKNGKGQWSGSNNLHNSGLTYQGTRGWIQNGQNKMPAYKGYLSEQEIKAVAKYVMQFKEE
jgi:uncharacterized membrane protein SirB2